MANVNVNVNDNIINYIAPINLNIYKTNLLVSEKYSQALVITKYPTFPQYGWLSKLANLEGTTMSTTFFPTDTTPLTALCNKQVNQYNRDLAGKLEESERQQKEKQLEHTRELIKRIGDGELIGYVSTVLLVQASSEEILNKRVKFVRNTIVAMQAASRIIATRQEDGYLAITPYGIPNDEILTISDRNMPLSTLLGGFFYESSGLNDQKGFKLGSSNGKPVILDDWIRNNDRTNGNWFIGGVPGVGKSTFVCLLLIYQYALGAKIIINDPEGEYVDIVKNLRGKIIPCGGGKGKFNILEVRPVPKADDDEEDDEDDLYKDEGDGTSDLAMHIQTFRVWLNFYKKDYKDHHIAKVEKILYKTYEKKNIFFDTDTTKLKPTDYPILSELYDDIEEEYKLNPDDKDLDYILTTLYSCAYGADATLFNGHTTVEFDNDIILLHTGPLINTDEAIFNSQFHNINSWVWKMVSRDRNEKILYLIDEGYLMVDSDYPQNVKFLKIFSKRIRKYMGALLFVTHSVVDLLDESVKKHGQAILDNACYKMLMGTDGKNLQETCDLFNLTKKEKILLGSKTRGKGILFVGNKRMELVVEVPLKFLKMMGERRGK